MYTLSTTISTGELIWVIILLGIPALFLVFLLFLIVFVVPKRRKELRQREESLKEQGVIRHFRAAKVSGLPLPATNDGCEIYQYADHIEFHTQSTRFVLSISKIREINRVIREYNQRSLRNDFSHHSVRVVHYNSTAWYLNITYEEDNTLFHISAVDPQCMPKVINGFIEDINKTIIPTSYEL